uniref:Chloride channel CLIC-like protein 1 n=1 Tax=Parastrongyloides trichosuri TaxID=131310 RepID=A0A0N4ZRW4_PARTI
MAAMNLNDNLEDACRSKGTFFESFFNYFQIFQLTKSKSECLMRHEDMLISPFSEINILSVIVKVLTSAIFTPLSVFGQQSNEFYNEYFRDTTLPLFLVKFTILILVIMLGFFYLSNFQISTWFWTFGPSKVPREIQGPKEKIKEIFIKEKEPLKALGSSQGDKNKSKSPVLKKRKLSLT